MKFSMFQASRRGARQKNEDRVGYCYTRDAALFLLADGMGGHPEGEVASLAALKVAAGLFERMAKPALPDPAAFLVLALYAAQEGILSYARERGMRDTPRTTLVAAVIQDARLYWLHCGDSRLYLVRQGTLSVRTRDHSMAERYASELPPDAPINRNVLYTCIGSPAAPQFDQGGPLPLWSGDKLLLCSDGFWGNLSDEEIVEGMTQGLVSQTVPPLVERALRQGGPTCDNVTVLALDWDPAHHESHDAVVTDAHDPGEFATTRLSDFDRDLPDTGPKD